MNATYIGDGLYNKFFCPQNYRKFKVLRENALKKLLSGNILIVPIMLYSLLKKQSRDHFARLDKELQERGAKAPEVGQQPPNVALTSLDLKRTVYLEELLKRKPITVLNFGSYTWPPWADLTKKILEISNKYAKDVQVITIYIREIHAQDGWAIPHNTVCYLQPTNLEGRACIANDFITQQKASELDLWLDQIDNSAAILYLAEPERLFVIKDNRIVFVGGMGPFDYDPWKVEDWLKAELSY